MADEETIRVWIHPEETYPDYLLDPPADETSSEWEKTYRDRHTYAVLTETYERWAAAATAYTQAQEEIREFVRTQVENRG